MGFRVLGFRVSRFRVYGFMMKGLGLYGVFLRKGEGDYRAYVVMRCINITCAVL